MTSRLPRRGLLIISIAAVFTGTASLVLWMLPAPHPGSDYVVTAALAFLACVVVGCAVTVWILAYRSRGTGRKP